jgi:hypothetical protein
MIRARDGLATGISTTSMRNKAVRSSPGHVADAAGELLLLADRRGART